MQVLIFSDLHLHIHKKNPERLEHCLQALNWVFDIAEENNIKDIIFCGDLFHDRNKIDIYTYCKTFELFNARIKDKNFWAILGNHDLWYRERWDVSSVLPLSAISGINVINTACTIKIAGKDLSFLPFTLNPIEDLNKIKNSSDYKILFSHIAIDGAKLNSFGSIAEVSIEHDGDMVKVGIDSFKNWDQIFLGHYHAEQKLTPNAEYIGSPLELDFSEAFQEKHIIIYDLETHEKKYVINNFSPKHLIINAQDIDNYEIKNNFIRLKITDTTSVDILELQNKIKEKYSVLSIEISQIEKSSKDADIIDNAKSMLLEQEELITEYIKQSSPKELDNNLLLEIGMQLKNAELSLPLELLK